LKKKKSKTKFHYCEETDCYFEKTKNFFAIVVVKKKVKLLCEITTILQQQSECEKLLNCAPFFAYY